MTTTARPARSNFAMMIRIGSVRRLVSWCSVVLGVAVLGGPAAAKENVALGLQARLFHSGTGQFSADVLAPGGPELVNVVGSRDPSSATLVTVQVGLPQGVTLKAGARLRLVARESGSPGRLLLDQSVPLLAVPAGSAAYTGFWLQGTGCKPVHLRAVLTAPSTTARLSAELPFACGE